MLIFVLNPGSTSTKLAIFSNDREVVSERIDHSADDLKAFSSIFDQFDYRFELVSRFLEKYAGVGGICAPLDAIVSRGGLVRPVSCGTYRINASMVDDLKKGIEGHHASNLGPAIAYRLSGELNIPAYIVDPITVDELSPYARLTGMPGIVRQSRLHTLNHKAVARKAAALQGKRYDEMNFVICHLGTGMSIAAHQRGRVIDMCDARGEGPMSGDRCGGVNTFLALEAARTGGSEASEAFYKKMYQQGGLFAHLGTKDLREIRRRIHAGDEKAALVLHTMIFQCAKEIGAQAAVLSGEVDAVIITGGMAYDRELTEELSSMIRFIAPVIVMPGEEEMKALALGALRVLTGEEQALDYPAERNADQQLQDQSQNAEAIRRNGWYEHTVNDRK